MKLCIFGETKDFDIAVYKALVIKIFHECFGIENLSFHEPSFDPYGKGILLKQLALEIDLASDTNSDLNFIFVFADSDDKSFEEQEREIDKLVRGKVKNFAYEAIIIAVPQKNIEAWLLSDIGAINKTAGRKYKTMPEAEKIAKPKEKLREIYGKEGKKTTYSKFALSIIEKINIDVLTKQSKSFNSFHQKLISRIRQVSKASSHIDH